MTELTELYRTSLEEKKRTLQQGLNRLGYGDLEPGFRSASLDKGLRTRAKLKLYHRDGTLRVCGTDPLRGEVALRDMLWILPPWVRGQVPELLEALLERHSEFPVDGCELKLAHGRRQVHVTLSVSRASSKDCAPLAGALLSRFRELTGVAVPSQGASFGDPWIKHEIGGREFQAHHTAFFQSHPELTPELLDITHGMMAGPANRGVLDLYCGAGLLSLHSLSRDVGIVGVDSARWAVESARINAARMGFSDARFVCEPVEAFVETASLGSEGVVVLDPPRSGIPGQVIRRIARRGPQHVCLVSCFTETLFRDLETWASCGYGLREIAALDMFPFTTFLETVSRLEKTA